MAPSSASALSLSTARDSARPPKKTAQEHGPHPSGNRGSGAAENRLGVLATEHEPREAAEHDRSDLAHAPGRERHQAQGQDRDRRARLVRRKASRHPEHGLGDNGDGDELEAMDEAVARPPGNRAGGIGEQGHRDSGRQRETGPGRQAAEIAGPRQADGEAGLAARGTGQELAEGDEVGESAIVEPSAPDDESLAEVAQMRDRPAEAGQAEPQEDAQDFERRRRATGRGCHGVTRASFKGAMGRRSALVFRRAARSRQRPRIAWMSGRSLGLTEGEPRMIIAKFSLAGCAFGPRALSPAEVFQSVRRHIPQLCNSEAGAILRA